MKIFGSYYIQRASQEAGQEWLNAMLAEIERHLPRMLREHPDPANFWHWFCGEADSFLSHAAQDQERLLFQDRVNRILEDAGVVERFKLTASARNPQCTEDPEWPAE